MKVHDPFCPLVDPCGWDDDSGHLYENDYFTWCYNCERSCFCAVIDRVRKDQQEKDGYALLAQKNLEKVYTRALNATYARGVKDAAEAMRIFLGPQ